MTTSAPDPYYNDDAVLPRSWRAPEHQHVCKRGHLVTDHINGRWATRSGRSTWECRACQLLAEQKYRSSRAVPDESVPSHGTMDTMGCSQATKPESVDTYWLGRGDTDYDNIHHLEQTVVALVEALERLGVLVPPESP